MRRFDTWSIRKIGCRFLFVIICSCGGGGDGGNGGNTGGLTPAAAPELWVQPAEYNFGIVTGDNRVEPLAVTIRNNGTADLRVTGMALSDEDNFSLNENQGTNPCGSAMPNLGPGESCNVTVDFAPIQNASYSSELTVSSNDATTPTYILRLLGNKEPLSQLNVTINQITPACPRPGLSTIYVSVLDQAGFPVAGLLEDDFEITEAGRLIGPPTSLELANQTLSVALAMDYSGSITQEPDNVEKMENAAIGFVNQLSADDEAEIIKYAATIEVTQDFTADKTLLIEAIQTTPELGVGTALYDSIFEAAGDLSHRTKDRKAIIVITDGVDTDGTGQRISTHTLREAIEGANFVGVPVFTVGLAVADAGVLQRIADETGGTYSDSTTAANLATIYRQLADLLLNGQYILTYTSISNGALVVEASDGQGLSGFNSAVIPACP